MLLVGMQLPCLHQFVNGLLVEAALQTAIVEQHEQVGRLSVVADRCDVAAVLAVAVCAAVRMKEVVSESMPSTAAAAAAAIGGAGTVGVRKIVGLVLQKHQIPHSYSSNSSTEYFLTDYLKKR